jgi:phosphatidate cytidylyltransferase
MLRWRFLLGAVMIAVLVGLCWLDHRATVPGTWLRLVAIAVAVLATKEVLDLAAASGTQPIRWLVYLANVLLIWLNSGPRGVEQDPHGYIDMSPRLVLGIATIAIFVAEICRYRKPGGNLLNIAVSIFTLVYVGVMLCHAVQLRLVWGIGALVSWIVVVKMGDTGAYAVGSWIGRHKMAPLLSPGKTIEGALGALAFSCLGSWLAFRWLVPLLTPQSLPVGPAWGWLTFGLLVGGAGILGDLAESLLKRDVGVKDSSTWLPGFGGVLDIIDSLLFSAPVAWLCWACGWVGR